MKNFGTVIMIMALFFVLYKGTYYVGENLQCWMVGSNITPSYSPPDCL